MKEKRGGGEKLDKLFWSKEIFKTDKFDFTDAFEDL